MNRPLKKSTKPELQKQGRHPKMDDKDQSKAFIDKARELEADEGRSEADRLIGSLARLKPEPRPKAKMRDL